MTVKVYADKNGTGNYKPFTEGEYAGKPFWINGKKFVVNTDNSITLNKDYMEKHGVYDSDGRLYLEFGDCVCKLISDDDYERTKEYYYGGLPYESWDTGEIFVEVLIDECAESEPVGFTSYLADDKYGYYTDFDEEYVEYDTDEGVDFFGWNSEW